MKMPNMTPQDIRRIELVYSALVPEDRHEICDQVKRLLQVENALNAKDMGCSAYRIRMAIDVLLDQKTAVQNMSPNIRRMADL